MHALLVVSCVYSNVTCARWLGHARAGEWAPGHGRLSPLRPVQGRMGHQRRVRGTTDIITRTVISHQIDEELDRGSWRAFHVRPFMDLARSDEPFCALRACRSRWGTGTRG